MGVAGQEAAGVAHRYTNNKYCRIVKEPEERTVGNSQAHDATWGNSNEGSKERLEGEPEPAGPRIEFKDVQNHFHGLLRHMCVMNDVRISFLCHSWKSFHEVCADMSFSTRNIKPAAEHASSPVCEPSITSMSILCCLKSCCTGFLHDIFVHQYVSMYTSLSSYKTWLL